MFCCRSSSDKQKWLQAFSEERKIVAQDESAGLKFHAAAKQLARVAAKCQKRPPRKIRGNLLIKILCCENNVWNGFNFFL